MGGSGGVSVAVAIRSTARVGEGPFWSATTGRLSWVDILGGLLMDSDPITGVSRQRLLPTLVGAAVPAVGGGSVVACREGFGVLSRHGSWTVSHPMLAVGERMNDAKCDTAGRLWAGSTTRDFRAGRGALHVLAGGAVRTVVSGLTLPNGIGWSPDDQWLYLVDTVAGVILRYAFQPADGQIGTASLVRRFDTTRGMPDGLCVDAEGCLWVACWGGSRLERISPEGELLQTVPMPVQQPSSCAFGGPELDRLYVTSAREGLDLDAESPDGSVFVVDGLPAPGLPVAEYRP